MPDYLATTTTDDERDPASSVVEEKAKAMGGELSAEDRARARELGARYEGLSPSDLLAEVRKVAAQALGVLAVKVEGGNADAKVTGSIERIACICRALVKPTKDKLPAPERRAKAHGAPIPARI